MKSIIFTFLRYCNPLKTAIFIQAENICNRTCVDNEITKNNEVTMVISYQQYMIPVIFFLEN